MSSHTQGPWIVDSLHISEVQTTYLKSVASCWYADCEGKNITVCGVLDCSVEESAANARLIAAAPAMLDALISCANFLECIEGISRNNMEQLASEELAQVVKALEQAVGRWEGSSADS